MDEPVTTVEERFSDPGAVAIPGQRSHIYPSYHASILK